jgi:general secretion pathway protein D
MFTHRCLTVLVTVLALALPIVAETSGGVFKKAVKAEQQGDLDVAYNLYKQAYTLEPNNARYFAAFTKIRFAAGSQHLRKGIELRNGGSLQQALTEFQTASAIDPSNFVAQQEVRRTSDMLAKQERQKNMPPEKPSPKPMEELEKPLELQPLSTSAISMYMTANADVIYKTIGKLAGLNVLIDPDYKPQKITVDLTNVTIRDALEMVRLQSKTFWRPVLQNAIFVSTDSAAKRKELEQNVMKTFYLHNIEAPNDLQEAANVLKQMLDVTRVQVVQGQDALILRGTPDQMVLAEKLLADYDKPKGEVIIDVSVMEVSRDRMRNLGSTLPTSFNVGVTQTPATSGSSSSSSSGSSANSGSSFAFNTLSKLSSGNFVLSLPGGAFTILATDSNTKVLQNPEIRALNNEKATLRIGDRVPIATGSFQPGIVGGAGGVSPLVSTQFQYLDVGVNIDITPHIHSDHDVTLKMSLEISTVTGEQNIGGITQPVIGQRRIEHEARLTDGEVNLLGGILEDTDTQSMSGYPWVSKIPILKYLFAQDNKHRTENEIVFAITPHIVRAPDITDENLRTLEVGTGSTIELRRKGPAAPAGTAPDHADQSKNKGQQSVPQASASPRQVGKPADYIAQQAR